jgi:large conductance mechanosensitive channel
MALWEDFRKFAFKGNVVDLAVGVVIGAAFGKIVTAMVSDVVMPIVALMMPGGEWRDNGFVLRPGATPKDTVILKYGDFLGAIVDFFIVAFVLFIVVSKIVKAAETGFKKPGEAVPVTKECPYCMEIIPIAARRCKACTSDLTAAPAPAAAAKIS